MKPTQKKSNKLGIPLGPQERVEPDEVVEIAARARVRLCQDVGEPITGKQKLAVVCLDCSMSVVASPATLRAGSVPCNCPNKNLRAWGDPRTAGAVVWAQAFFKQGITSEIALKSKNWGVHKILSERNLLDEIEHESKRMYSSGYFEIKRKILWHKWAETELNAELEKYQFISDSPKRLQNSYVNICKDQNYERFLSQHPDIQRQRKRPASTDSERDIKLLASAIKESAEGKLVSTLSDFCKRRDHQLANFIHGTDRQEKIVWPNRWRHQFSLLDLIKRWCQIKGYFPSEQLWLRIRQHRKPTSDTWVALLKDERRRQAKLHGKSVNNLGDLWEKSGGGLAKRFRTWLAEVYEDALDRESAKAMIMKAAGLDEPLRDWGGYTVAMAIREVTRSKIMSAVALREKRWDIYKWLNKDKMRLEEFMVSMGWHGYWYTAAFTDRLFASSFEAIVASVARCLGIHVECQVLPFPGRQFRADFRFNNAAWGEVWMYNPECDRPGYKQVYAQQYLHIRNVKESLYKDHPLPKLDFEVEQYYGKLPIEFATYVKRRLREFFTNSVWITERELLHCADIRQRSSADMEEDRLSWSKRVMIMSRESRRMIEDAVPDSINEEPDKGILGNARNSATEICELLRYIGRVKNGWVVRRPHSHRASPVFMSDYKFGTPRISLLHAINNRDDYMGGINAESKEMVIASLRRGTRKIG